MNFSFLPFTWMKNIFANGNEVLPIGNAILLGKWKQLKLTSGFICRIIIFIWMIELVWNWFLRIRLYILFSHTYHTRNVEKESSTFCFELEVSFSADRLFALREYRFQQVSSVCRSFVVWTLNGQLKCSVQKKSGGNISAAVFWYFFLSWLKENQSYSPFFRLSALNRCNSSLLSTCQRMWSLYTLSRVLSVKVGCNWQVCILSQLFDKYVLETSLYFFARIV